MEIDLQVQGINSFEERVIKASKIQFSRLAFSFMKARIDGSSS